MPFSKLPTVEYDLQMQISKCTYTYKLKYKSPVKCLGRAVVCHISIPRLPAFAFVYDIPHICPWCLSKEGSGDNIFIDMSQSVGRGEKCQIESCQDCSTCITPAHPIYSVKLRRYITGKEMLGLQAVWKVDSEDKGVFDRMAHSRLAQDLAGNGMTGTVVQAVALCALSTSDALLQIDRCLPRDKPLKARTQPVPHMDVVPHDPSDSFENHAASGPPSDAVPLPEACRSKGQKRKANQLDGPCEMLVPKHRLRGKQTAMLLKVAAPKKHHGSGNKKAGGKSTMISIYEKEQICQAYEQLRKDGCRNPHKEMMKKSMKGYFRGCIMPSKWGTIRHEQQWTLLCETAPRLCRANKELPNSLRQVMKIPKLKSGGSKQGSKNADAQTRMPIALQRVIEEAVMERVSAGEEVANSFVQNTILWCCKLWNDCVGSIREMIQSSNLKILKDSDDRLATMSHAELNKLFESLIKKADEMLVTVNLAKTDAALVTLVKLDWVALDGPQTYINRIYVLLFFWCCKVLPLAISPKIHSMTRLFLG